MVAITIRIPPYPSDEWITSPLYTGDKRNEGHFFMPWVQDAPGPSMGRLYIFNLHYFAHMCKIRAVQARILSSTRKLPPVDVSSYMARTRTEIDQWADMDTLSVHGQQNAEGYSSTLGLVYVGHLTRVVLYTAMPLLEAHSQEADQLMQACCDACATARVLEKKRQTPNPWFDVGFVSTDNYSTSLKVAV